MLLPRFDRRWRRLAEWDAELLETADEQAAKSCGRRAVLAPYSRRVQKTWPSSAPIIAWARASAARRRGMTGAPSAPGHSGQRGTGKPDLPHGSSGCYCAHSRRVLATTFTRKPRAKPRARAVLAARAARQQQAELAKAIGVKTLSAEVPRAVDRHDPQLLRSARSTATLFRSPAALGGSWVCRRAG
jgi:hypothetical protein